jgi:hypothetical protein
MGREKYFQSVFLNDEQSFYACVINQIQIHSYHVEPRNHNNKPGQN